MQRAALALATLVALSCAREAEPQAPLAPFEGPASPGVYGYGWPPSPVPPAPAAAPTPAGWNAALASGSPRATTAAAAAQMSSQSIPDGPACLHRLSNLGVGYQPLEHKRGVVTPVVVDGTIGGIRYYANGDLPLVCDCRLAAALREVAPLLRRHGVTAMRFSGAYVYRTTRSGRPSLHARGLAIDIHDLVIAGRVHSVKRDYSRGMADGCTATAPPLNRIACALRRTGLFRELLTPDYDRDHHDHFHLGLAPCKPGSSTPERLAAQPH